MTDSSLGFSLVIPAYNESRRLPPYLVAVRRYCGATFGSDYEVIVVDDGSTDNLGDVLADETADWPQFRLLRHAQNQGKGAAVRTGITASLGRIVLFADADGATPIEEHSKLAAEIEAGADVAVGSRLLAADGVKRSRNWARGLAGRVFAGAVRRMLRVGVRDTQCGFKMFRGPVGRQIFARVCERGYLFDLETLALATRLGCRIAEVPVRWQEIPGGHLSLIRDLPRILGDLMRLRRRLSQSGPRESLPEQPIRREG